jgi:RNA polymerase sigma-70 factor, ECF subfamily
MDRGCELKEQAKRGNHSPCEEADEALIGAIASGDDGAMTRLYERYKIRVFRFIVRIVGDATLAEDLLSEVFLEIWRQAGKFRMHSQVSTWILAIARFKAWSARGQVRQDADIDDVEGRRIEDSTDSPETAALKNDRALQLRGCLARLSPEHQEIIDLAYYHEKTITEIAQIIQVPRNTVKTRMFYARKRLEGLLRRHEDFSDLSTPEAA